MPSTASSRAISITTWGLLDPALCHARAVVAMLDIQPALDGDGLDHPGADDQADTESGDRHTGGVDEGVGEFLRSRRARLTPEQAGILPLPGRRRVAGLRREELSQLAGVSVDYYVRLEQGRTSHVSDAVLDAVAQALQLTTTEREHLANLARPVKGARTTRPPVGNPGVDTTDVTLSRLLGMMDGVPALMLGPTMDAIAWNALAHALFEIGDRSPAQRNIARLTFLDPRSREHYQTWDTLAAAVIAHLHLQVGRYPYDSDLIDLIDDLSGRSAQFRSLWTNQDVREGATMAVAVDHPAVGWIELTNVWLTPPTRPDLVLVAYTAEPGSLSQARLQALGARRADTVGRIAWQG